MLAGKSPYVATSMDELFAQIANRTPPRLAKLPGEVNAIVEEALASGMFRDAYGEVFAGDDLWRGLPVAEGGA